MILHPDSQAHAKCSKCDGDLYFSKTIPTFVKCMYCRAWRLFAQYDAVITQLDGDNEPTSPLEDKF